MDDTFLPVRPSVHIYLITRSTVGNGLDDKDNNFTGTKMRL